MEELTREAAAKAVRAITLVAGRDAELDFMMDGMQISVFFFWHSPSLNLSWYPIVQVDVDDVTKFHHEGAENHLMWQNLVDWTADFILKYEPKKKG